MSEIIKKFGIFFEKYVYKVILISCILFIGLNFYIGEYKQAWAWFSILFLNILIHGFTGRQEEQ